MGDRKPSSLPGEGASGRRDDGSAGDVDYRGIGVGYTDYRRPDPMIAAQLHARLGSAHTVLNIGAGAGSYEPLDRTVVAVEPSQTMRDHRPATHPVAIDATAEQLPFEDGCFDAAMASFTVHQWADLGDGLREVRRVTRGPIVILTCDPTKLTRFWLHQYAPEVIDTEAGRYPHPEVVREYLAAVGDRYFRVESVKIPLQCTDGFNEAYYGRPEMLLDLGARRANSAWSFLTSAAVDRFASELARDLADGTWDARYGALRDQPSFDGSLVLMTSS